MPWVKLPYTVYRIRAYLRSLYRAIRYCRNAFPLISNLLGRRKPFTAVLRKSGLIFHDYHIESFLATIHEIIIQDSYRSGWLRVDWDDLVVDIGANIGVFTVWAAKQTRYKVFAVEPVPENAECLRRNIDANGLHHVTVETAAITGTTGEVALRKAPVNVGYRVTGNAESESQSVFKVPSLTLNDFMKRHTISRIDFLKVDCEGSEGSILQSLEPDVFRIIRKIAVEYHDEWSSLNHAQIADLLQKNGYEIKLKPHRKFPYGYILARRHSQTGT